MVSLLSILLPTASTPTAAPTPRPGSDPALATNFDALMTIPPADAGVPDEPIAVVRQPLASTGIDLPVAGMASSPPALALPLAPATGAVSTRALLMAQLAPPSPISAAPAGIVVPPSVSSSLVGDDITLLTDAAGGASPQPEASTPSIAMPPATKTVTVRAPTRGPDRRSAPQHAPSSSPIEEDEETAIHDPAPARLPPQAREPVNPPTPFADMPVAIPHDAAAPAAHDGATPARASVADQPPPVAASMTVLPSETSVAQMQVIAPPPAGAALAVPPAFPPHERAAMSPDAAPRPDSVPAASSSAPSPALDPLARGATPVMATEAPASARTAPSADDRQPASAESRAGDTTPARAAAAHPTAEPRREEAAVAAPARWLDPAPPTAAALPRANAGVGADSAAPDRPREDSAAPGNPRIAGNGIAALPTTDAVPPATISRPPTSAGGMPIAPAPAGGSAVGSAMPLAAAPDITVTPTPAPTSSITQPPTTGPAGAAPMPITSPAAAVPASPVAIPIVTGTIAAGPAPVASVPQSVPSPAPLAAAAPRVETPAAADAIADRGDGPPASVEREPLPRTAPEPAFRAFAAALFDAARDVSPVAPTVAAPLADPRPLDLTHPRWPHAMIDRIERLRDEANLGDTRIRLIPDALGTIDVALRRDGETVHVAFRAEQAETRQLLAEARPELTALAEARGVRIAEPASSPTNSGTSGQTAGGGTNGQTASNQTFAGHDRAPRQQQHASTRAASPRAASAAEAQGDDTRIA